ncbi:MAG: hypothetical protein FGM37_01550 [Phycisphaerales bacterium]|nr:hypothetical protein [Phycisphaerales bacterium]
MHVQLKNPLLAAGAIIMCASGVSAAEILVTQNIATSTTWTANNTYNLQQQIYVLPGATLTIEPGTIIASTTGLGGSLAVTRGARIFARGTQENPIIFTSKADVATWTNGNPKTGTWRAVCNEWGNLTIMGRAYISENAVTSNSATFSANNVAAMEGLVGSSANDPNVIYGGGNDDDDSGSLSYVSFRYGGRVIGLNNELNGLSLGGIGRQTVIDHMEIMNNVDDGIEIWGGTVNLQNFAIWNIGDDSLDIDQGWRGKAQFGLIVQGYSASAPQGSGVGDNAIEIDGAEQSDYQPVTTCVLYNMTVIGDRGTTGANGCDHGVAYRDNARVQIRNSIFMDLGERLVAIDNVDGDGGAGYGHNGTLSWAATWTTPYSTFSTVNAPTNPALFYRAQVDGFLNEIKDSVFFNNTFSSAYTEADARGVRAAGNSNVTATASPIVSLTRGATVSPTTTLRISPVTGIDPRAANDAVTSVGSAPNDGFFVQANYRGAFSPQSHWLCSWTAADAYGFVTAPAGSCAVGTACPADINGSGAVDGSDLTQLLAAWGSSNAPAADVNDDNTVDGLDLAAVLAGWGPCN